jgi:DNA-binding XRE family transcriptional regulator
VYKNKLRELLDKRQISQAKLSRVVDVSINTIQLLSHDPCHDAFNSTLVKIARALITEDLQRAILASSYRISRRSYKGNPVIVMIIEQSACICLSYSLERGGEELKLVGSGRRHAHWILVSSPAISKVNL